MPLVHRKTDLCTGHPLPPSPVLWPPRPATTWSPDVYVNSLNVERFGDELEIHCFGSCHPGKYQGKHTVFVNGRDKQTTTDPIDCGSLADKHSLDVWVDG